MTKKICLISLLGLTLVVFKLLGKPSFQQENTAPTNQVSHEIEVEGEIKLQVVEPSSVKEKGRYQQLDSSRSLVSSKERVVQQSFRDIRSFPPKKRWANGYSLKRGKDFTQSEPQELMNTINQIIRDAQRQIKGYPGRQQLPPFVHDNATLTAVLLGENPSGLKFLSKEMSFVNSNGEIVDPWGVPLFFHFLDSQTVDIRSAGPDQSMWNEDDLTLLKSE